MHSPPALNLHSLQTPQLSGYSFTNPASSSVGIWSFGLTNSCLRVVLGRKETLNPSGDRTRWTASDRPRTYGRVTTGPCEWLSAGLVGAGVVWCCSTLLGNPLLIRACLMCLVLVLGSHVRADCFCPYHAVSWPSQVCGPVGAWWDIMLR